MFCCKQKCIYCYFIIMIVCSFNDNAGVVNGEMLLTYELCWFIWPLVDECFESLLHGVDKLVVLHEADVDDVIHLVFKIQQLLHHCFVFFWIDYDCASKSLKVDLKKNKMEKQLPTEYAK